MIQLTNKQAINSIKALDLAIARKKQSLRNFERKLERAISENQDNINVMKKSKLLRISYILELQSLHDEIQNQLWKINH